MVLSGDGVDAGPADLMRAASNSKKPDSSRGNQLLTKQGAAVQPPLPELAADVAEQGAGRGEPMLIDGRIPVCVTPAGDPVPPDPLAVLVYAGSEQDPGQGSAGHDRDCGWGATRRVSVDLPAGAEVSAKAGSWGSLAPAHAAGCTCCITRSPLALLLSTLFQQRARNEIVLFRRVVLIVSPALAEATRSVINGDPLVNGRYRSS